MSRKPKYPGYHQDTLPSGNRRHRVRVEGNPNKWITIYAAPGDPNFRDQYFDARAGVLVTKPKPDDKPPTRSFALLSRQYLEYLKVQCDSELISPSTFKKATLYLDRMTKAVGKRPMLLEKKILVQARNALSDRPAAADDTITRIAQMYEWAIECGKLPETTVNPAASISKIDKGKGGAVPWATKDVEKYCQRHSEGSPARLMLIIHIFTGCRIGDAVWLGADQEKRIEVPEPGWVLEWKTQKTGTLCTVPMSLTLYHATRPFAVEGRPYIVKPDGEPYASAGALGQRFKKWCWQADLKNRSSHGVRKMVAGLIASSGADSHAIAALLGHTSTKTTEVYTRAFNRQLAAASAIAKLSVDV
ncbi:MAG: tyrosine-type recombinase/integrase [Pseudomonadota bacterium]